MTLEIDQTLKTKSKLSLRHLKVKYEFMFVSQNKRIRIS